MMSFILQEKFLKARFQNYSSEIKPLLLAKQSWQ